MKPCLFESNVFRELGKCFFRDSYRREFKGHSLVTSILYYHGETTQANIVTHVERCRTFHIQTQSPFNAKLCPRLFTVTAPEFLKKLSLKSLHQPRNISPVRSFIFPTNVRLIFIALGPSFVSSFQIRNSFRVAHYLPSNKTLDYRFDRHVSTHVLCIPLQHQWSQKTNTAVV